MKKLKNKLINESMNKLINNESNTKIEKNQLSMN